MNDSTAVQVATAEQESQAYALLLECSHWLKSSGITQWLTPYPRDRFARDVAAGGVRLWLRGEEAVATATVSSHRPEYYPSHVWSGAERAWYVCRLAVSRAHAGEGLGARVLSELTEEARAANISALRLDVVAANPFLGRYYEARGFTLVTTAPLMGEDAAFLERRF